MSESGPQQERDPAIEMVPGPAHDADRWRGIRQRAAHAWQDLISAVIDGAAAPVGLLFLPLTIICLLLSVVGIGVPATVGVIGATRSLANWHRRRAAVVLGRPVDSPYAPEPQALTQRFRGLLRESATWRDIGWLALNAPLGIGIAAVSVGLWLAGPQCLLAPAIQPFVPSGVTFDPLLLDVTDQSRAWLMVLASPAVLVLAATGPGILNQLRARAACALLAPTAAAGLRARIGRLAASRDVAVDSSAAELRRIERDLHDGAQARLVSLSMNLGIADDFLDADPALARRMILDARDNAGVVLGEIRSLVRGIHPPVLADRGLPGAVQALALTSPVPVLLDLRLTGRLPAPIESAGYFVIAEALANAIRHSGADRIAITLAHDGTSLVATVADNGRGGAEPGGGTGLRGIQRRLVAFDGSLTISSPAQGPTVLHVEIPCES